MSADVSVGRFRLQVKVRNNRLIKAREEIGLTCQEAARAIGISYGKLVKLESLKIFPLGAGGEWRRVCRSISDFYGLGLEWFWSEEVRAVREAAIERQIDTFAGVGLMAAREATALLSDGSTPADEVVSEHEKEKLVTEVLDKLTPRERRVLELRFGIGGKSDHTLEELGQDFEISRERIRQIEAKALRKLRHPSLADALRDFK